MSSTTINRLNGFEAYYLISTRTRLFNNHTIDMNSFEFPTNTSRLISSLGFNIIHHNNSEVAVVSIPDGWGVVMNIYDGGSYAQFCGPNNITLTSFVGYKGNNYLLVHMPNESNYGFNRHSEDTEKVRCFRMPNT